MHATRTPVVLSILGASLLLAGCAGASAGALAIGLVMIATLGLGACTSDGGGGEDSCSGQWQWDCWGNRVCCPTGVACNYWCGDGADGETIDGDTLAAETTAPTEVVDADAGCDGAWESACREGRIVQLCCPAGLACNYGQTMVDCGDGTCVEMPATCPP